MKIKILFLALMLFIPLVATASATNGVVNYPEDGEQYGYSSFVNGMVEVTVTDALDTDIVLVRVYNENLSKIMKTWVIYDSDYEDECEEYLAETYPDYTALPTGLIELVPVTQMNGTVNMTMEDWQVPFSNQDYSIIVENETFVDYDSVTFQIGGGYNDTQIAVRNFVPDMFEFYFTSLSSGLSFEAVSTFDNKTMYLALTNTTSSDTIYVASDGEKFIVPDYYYDDGHMRWNTYVSKPSSVLTLWSQYHWFLGYNASWNVYWNLLGASSGYETIWSTDGVGYTVTLDDTQDYDYDGMYIYFETTPFGGDDGSGWKPDSTNTDYSWGQIIKNYMSADPPNGLGLPWGHLIIAFIIIIVCMLVPLSFAIRMDITIPNLVYGVSGFFGFMIATGIGLLEFWMLLILIIGVVLTIVFKYREEMSVIFEYAHEHLPVGSAEFAYGKTRKHVTGEWGQPSPLARKVVSGVKKGYSKIPDYPFESARKIPVHARKIWKDWNTDVEVPYHPFRPRAPQLKKKKPVVDYKYQTKARGETAWTARTLSQAQKELDRQYKKAVAEMTARNIRKGMTQQAGARNAIRTVKPDNPIYKGGRYSYGIASVGSAIKWYKAQKNKRKTKNIRWT